MEFNTNFFKEIFYADPIEWIKEYLGRDGYCEYCGSDNIYHTPAEPGCGVYSETSCEDCGCELEPDLKHKNKWRFRADSDFTEAWFNRSEVKEAFKSDCEEYRELYILCDIFSMDKREEWISFVIGYTQFVMEEEDENI